MSEPRNARCQLCGEGEAVYEARCYETDLTGIVRVRIVLCCGPCAKHYAEGGRSRPAEETA